MRKLFAAMLMVLLVGFSVVPTWADQKPKGSYSVVAHDRLIDIKGENVSLRKLLAAIDKESAINVYVSEKVADKLITVSLQNLPIYAIESLFKEIGLTNYAVAYDQSFNHIYAYVLAPSEDIAKVTQGKKTIRNVDFGDWRNADKVKGREIVTGEANTNSW
jgi:type II secretory pathway component GspD/PulD (secretin)